MDHYTLVQDFVVLLLAAGLAGLLCKRMGLSAIVGYLLAGSTAGFPLLARVELATPMNPFPSRFSVGPAASAVGADACRLPLICLGHRPALDH
jgi:Kef-type K+ transport system membrane component KefB